MMRRSTTRRTMQESKRGTPECTVDTLSNKLHKLLTDLPDDMLEDSRDSSSPELEYSTCSKKNTGNSPQANGAQQWSNHGRPTHEQNYEPNYNQFRLGDRVVNGHMNGHQGLSQPHVWNQPQGPQFSQGDYSYNSIGTENNDFSADDYGTSAYPQASKIPIEYNGDGAYGDSRVHGETRNHFQIFNSKPHQGQELDKLQREFLDSTANTADQEQLSQLRVLYKAQQRQIEDLEQKLEDSRRNMRYLEHQFAIVKDEKDGLAVSLKESGRLIEEYKDREVTMQKTVKALEHQVQLLTEKDQENMKKQRVADAAVDTMKQQMLDLCRSDTLSRSREQHDRDITILREQHDAALLASQQKIDSVSQALDQQVELTQKLREQVKQLDHQREEDQLERARVINMLTQRLEESQQQCAKLLQRSSVQEMSQLQIKLQQTQSAKALSENMNKVLQEDLAELKEQITLYESAVKHGVISLDLSNDLENHLSESCIDLRLKKTNLRNGTLHSPLANLSDTKLPKDEALRLLRAEMQRCLGNLKGKRKQIEQLREDLRVSQARADELQTQLEEAKLGSTIRGENSQENFTDMHGTSQKELKQLEEDKQHLQEQVEILEKKYKELKQNEEKVKAANLELCTKMREMIQELDQEKQEAAERSERVHQQHRDDVVQRIRAELIQEHTAQIEQLTQQHQQQLQDLQTQLSEAHDKMSAVQECYISVCKEKDALEESIRNKDNEETTLKQTKQKLQEEADAALKRLRDELETQHQASVTELKAVWTKDKEKEIQQKVDTHVAQINATWKEEMKKMEHSWSQKLEEANRKRYSETVETTSQTSDCLDRNVTVSAEELESRLKAQKIQLQTEMDRAKVKAVEETKRQVQKELHEKHLEDMAKQVEGAVTRAYNRWVEDLTSLPEYQASLQSEKEKWEECQQKLTDQKISQAVRAAEDLWAKRQRSQQEGQASSHLEEELQQTVSTLQSQLDQTRREQAALLKAELSAARTVWNRDKLQEINKAQVRSEQAYQKKLEQALQQVKEEVELEKKDLLSQTEARIQQAVKTREQELKCCFAEKEKAQMKEIKEEMHAEIQAALAQVQTQLFVEQQGSEEAKKTSRGQSEDTITHVVQNLCKNIVNRAVSQAKKEWKKMSEEKLSLVLKETQEQYEKEINKMQACAPQWVEQGRCRKECTETVSTLQKKNHELQRHLEKACRQLQTVVRENKAAMKKLKEEHEGSLQKIKEEHLQQLEEAKRMIEKSGSTDQQHFQQGLEDMKRQYLNTVEKIRGDMMLYLQESRERAAEMIRVEVQRERQDTARKMRHYYLTCLHELLEDGGQTTGAEKKIMNAASKLAAMAKVLETPIKNKPANYALTSGGTTVAVKMTKFEKSPLLEHSDKRLDVRVQQQQKTTDLNLKQSTTGRTKSVSHQDQPIPTQNTLTSCRKTSPSQSTDASVRSKTRNLLLQGQVAESSLDPTAKIFLQELPVREEKRPTDWSLSSNDSDTGPPNPRLSYSGRRVKPVKPFSVSVASNCDFVEFAGLTPDASDLTIYNEIVKKTPDMQNADFYNVNLGAHRQPTPGSESAKQYDICPKLLFSELRQRQQDSGFGSPFYQQKLK
ncbi:centrosomal protein of 152 kDa isoform X2 [Boleophthalmus pectinirostris]|uniref:centrosomal protein of 152 kDa isoform X2 n=1 Tax=Boleophthalmus pectinirostris TaxID=150288 RepID=UPI00242EA665|nr:centrosomal protein of 152 kDa isoform X2 [Boleophthalmus pectinirostris]